MTTMNEHIYTSDEIRQGLEDLAFIHAQCPHKTDILLLKYLEKKLDQALRREEAERLNDPETAFARYLPKQSDQTAVQAF